MEEPSPSAVRKRASSIHDGTTGNAQVSLAYFSSSFDTTSRCCDSLGSAVCKKKRFCLWVVDSCTAVQPSTSQHENMDNSQTHTHTQTQQATLLHCQTSFFDEEDVADKLGPHDLIPHTASVNHRQVFLRRPLLHRFGVTLFLRSFPEPEMILWDISRDGGLRAEVRTP